MSRSIGSIILSFIFLAFLAAPTVISMVDDSVDTSIFYSIAEEEENGCKIKVVLEVNSNNETDFDFSKRTVPNGYYFKKYPKPHLNLISPPPESHIL